MATVYHRRFHPQDVDGTVVYSAPNNVDDRDDSAYLRFLETVGTPAGREAVTRRRCLFTPTRRRGGTSRTGTSSARSRGTAMSPPTMWRT